MAPAMIVARELDIRTVDTISVKSYDWQKQGEAAEVLKAPDAGLMGDGTGILVVDDLVDTGKTLELVRKLYPKAHFATVYAKPQGREIVDTFITEVSQDTWIFFPWDMALQYVRPYRGD
jgi:xanthine phosphoribosyltransferase